MRQGGSGMRVAGRLAAVAVLCAPIVMASGAGAATSRYGALCGAGNALPTTNVGAINSVLVDNGVAGSGVLLQKRKPQQLRLAVANASCLPPPTGRQVVTGSKVVMKVTSATAVNCTDLRNGAILGGSGTFTWTAPPGMGKSPFSIRWRWTGADTIHFWGSVSSSVDQGNVFMSDHITGYVLTKEKLTAKSVGGNCTAVLPLAHWTIRSIVYQLKP
jgi:hypothetical protein